MGFGAFLVLAATWPVLVFAQERDDLAVSLEKIRAKYDLPALAAALARGGKLERIAVVGTRKYGEPIPPTINDKFHLGSCTKAMTATLVALLVEEGKLRWQSPLSELFADLPTLHADLRAVTLEMLLAHRSGLTGDLVGYDGGSLWRKLWEPSLEPTRGRRLVTEKLLSAPPSFKPGSRYVYGNASYIIVGAALERLTGESWESLMRKRLFVPLGMHSCGFGPPGNPKLERADQPWGHGPGFLSLTGPIPHEPGLHADNPATLGPAGTVHCSLSDWAKFLFLHVEGFQGNRGLLLKPATFAKLHQPAPGQEYTYGGWIRVERPWADGPVLTHEGNNTYNHAAAWLAPKKGAALLGATNYGGGGADNGVDQAIATIVKLLTP